MCRDSIKGVRVLLVLYLSLCRDVQGLNQGYEGTVGAVPEPVP